ncbi:phage tail assembly chaperone G [Streptococcus pluranimalium]|uniref:phage tail assembly chaperone G n=1 Tax=Streptococcus pluranimalium TaxID=82348 RepID=UPI004046F45B
MSTIEIKVRNEKGEKVVYENHYMPVSKYREYLEMQTKLENNDIPEFEKLDIQLQFIASLFDGLSVEAMYDGLEMSELNEIISDVFVKLVGGESDPKVQD